MRWPRHQFWKPPWRGVLGMTHQTSRKTQDTLEGPRISAVQETPESKKTSENIVRGCKHFTRAKICISIRTSSLTSPPQLKIIGNHRCLHTWQHFHATTLVSLSPSGCTFWGKKPWSQTRKIMWQVGMLLGAPVVISLIAGIAIPVIIVGIPIYMGRKVRAHTAHIRHARHFVF